MKPNVVKQSVVQHDGKHYFISTVMPPVGLGNSYETMIFHCDSDGNVTDWGEITVKYYNNYIDALNGHMEFQHYWHPSAPQ